MKKFGFLIFLAALAAGLMLAPSCNFKNNNNKSVQGSGTAKNETREVKNFTKINASGALEVEITIGKDFSVEVTADDNLIQSIKTESDGETLKIYMQENSSSKSRSRIKISLPELKGLDIAGASTASVAGVETDSMDLTASGVSKIKIEGQVKELDAQANGASTIDAENLKSEEAEVTANGSSTVSVSASVKLEAEANGASTISYTGDPKTVNQNSSGVSSINKK